MTGRAPTPGPALAIAIVGHRPDRLKDPGAISQRIGEVLDAVRKAVRDSSPSSAEPRLRLVSALAEGADRLGALAALDSDIGLNVVLPFPADEYVRDFASEESRTEFGALLGRAQAILSLDGEAKARDRAYEAAGHALLDNCDLLIAVFDDGPGRGRGGTREVIEEAVRRDCPVVTIDPAGTTARLRVASHGSPNAPRLEDLPVRPATDISTVVGAIVGGPEFRDEISGWLARSELPRQSWANGTYPLLLRLLGLGPRRPVAGREAQTPNSSLKAAFDWWDSTAVRAAQGFRSAVVMNFALAALAVVLAASSLLAKDMKWLFVVAEVVTILLLLGNVWSARRSRWQERWLESREVAELLRVLVMLRLAGIGRPLNNRADAGNTLSYALAMARQSPLEPANLSNPSAASRGLIEGIEAQASWNEANARRMHSAGHRLGRAGELLFVIVLAASIGWLALAAIRPPMADALKYVLTAITAGLPAVASASYGIRLILDFEGISERSRRMAGELRSLVAAWRSGPPTAASLQSLARSAMDVMLGDVAAWRMLAEGRRLSVPG